MYVINGGERVGNNEREIMKRTTEMRRQLFCRWIEVWQKQHGKEQHKVENLAQLQLLEQFGITW